MRVGVYLHTNFTIPALPDWALIGTTLNIDIARFFETHTTIKEISTIIVNLVCRIAFFEICVRVQIV